MPSIVHYKDGEKSRGPFERISANFTVEPDGFINLKMRFFAALQGLAKDAVKSIFPRLDKPLPEDLYGTIRGLPDNSGVYANDVSVITENGIQYIDITASACTRTPQFVVNATINTLFYNGTHTQPTSPPLILPYSFTLKLPTIRVSTCYLYSTTFPTTVIAETTGTNITPSFAPELILISPQIQKTYITTISNVKGRSGLNLANKTLSILESVTETQGSIVRGTKTYTLEVV
jgi:hypothetical protein